MPAKGTISGDIIPVNKFRLLVAGMVPITFVKVGALEEELERTDLPDRTRATGGNTKPLEFEVETPAHHKVEQVALEGWFRESKDPVSPTYKKTATLVLQSNTGAITRSFSILGMFPVKRGLPDLDMGNEGEAAMIKWTFSADSLVPLPV